VAGGDAEQVAYVAERVCSRAVAAIAVPDSAAAALTDGAAVVVASADAAFLGQVADALRAAGLAVTRTRDVAGARLAPLPTIPQRRERAA
jgi:glycerol-3-phosphate dehydrogenase